MKSKVRNFQIQTRLGSGSYGVIFRAINKTTKQQCVLKQIKMNKMSEKAKKNTLNEATIMGKLIHPFIVQYRQSFVEDSTLHIVMEYCDNGDLSMFLKMQNKKPLKEQKIWRIFIQICMGLQYIHKNKILHRDIKTLNIFLNKNEDIKIGDLGVAKMLTSDFAQTMVGTPFYLSPELCEQKPYNEKSDIWAMGCLLYELCTYKHPFEAANQASLILKIIRGKYQPIPEFYSKELKDLIACCLERDYKRRPTASMILARPKIKELIKEFEFEDKIRSEYDRIKANKQNKQPAVVSQKPKETRILNVKKPLSQEKSPKEMQKESSKDKKIENHPTQGPKSVQKVSKKPYPQEHKEIQKPPLPKPTVSGMPEKNIILPDKDKINQRLKSAVDKSRGAQVVSSEQRQQSKNQFMANLKKNVSQTDKANIQAEKQRLYKIDQKISNQLKKEREQIEQQKNRRQETPLLTSPKNPITYEKKSVPVIISTSKQQKQEVKPVAETVVMPAPPLPNAKNKNGVIKVKMQQPQVAPKVFEPRAGGSAVIKSKGFTKEIVENPSTRQEKKSDLYGYRKSVQNIKKPVLFGVDEEQKGRNTESVRNTPQVVSKSSSNYQSQKYIKVAGSEVGGSSSRIQTRKQPERYLFKKKPQGYSSKQIDSSSKHLASNPRVRKGSSNGSISRVAKNASKYSNSEVTKQEEDLVANLPDSLANGPDSSDEENAHHEGIKQRSSMNAAGRTGEKGSFKLKEINNDIVLQKYQEMLSSKSIENPDQANEHTEFQVNVDEGDQAVNATAAKQLPTPKEVIKLNKNLNHYEESIWEPSPKEPLFSHQEKLSESELDNMLGFDKKDEQLEALRIDNQESEEIFENESLLTKEQAEADEEGDDDVIQDESEECIVGEEDDDENIEEIYEVNNFDLNRLPYESEDKNQQCSAVPHSKKHVSAESKEDENQESFWEQEPNHHKQAAEEWSFEEEPELPMLQEHETPYFEEANPYLIDEQEETIEEKKNYLQIKLQENIKREDEINKLMQIKIEECRAIVPKNFEEILEFFRKKINMDDEYTESDEREVDEFLRKKGMTDQRKFQNIYKIMHFEMELENTSKIIQKICKKLGELESQG